ncbi:MAG: XdhC family protein [Elusimicrobiales bacterium]|nr:XdhC family protein [Elusimicrobiales bacterium]
MRGAERIIELLEAGEAFCAATVVSSVRSDLAAGARAVITAGGAVGAEGWPDDAKAALRAPALEALARERSHTAETAPGVLVFFDALRPAARLLICGAGHIAVPLARFAATAGFDVTVLDDRPDFASRERFPGCEVIAGDFRTELRAMRPGRAVYAVVITRGHEHDAECLEEILRKDTAYAGMIGSRRRVGFVLKTLEKKGLPPTRLADVFTPIGVPIGGESPEEIALSIAAELVCIRRRGAPAARALRDAV